MTPSDFNPDEFLAGITADGPNSTVVEAAPEGTYRGKVSKVTARRLDPDEKNPEARYLLEITWDILDDAVKAQLDRQTVTARQTIWLDMDENGALSTEKGKNVNLGRLRDSVNQNEVSGWNPNMLVDQMATIRVVQEADQRDKETKYARVQRVSPLA